MASTYLFSDVASGADLYFRIWNAAGEVFDFDDSSFKTIASAVTPLVTATYDTDGQFYVSDAAVDWSTVWNNGTPTDFIVFAYDNPTPADGDSPVTDAVVYTIQFGEIGAGSIFCAFGTAMTSSAGSSVRMQAWLERNGQRIVLGSGSCTVTVREQGSGSDLFTVTDASVNAEGVFELTQNSPGFTDDRLYKAKVEITENATAWTSYHDCQVWG